MLQAAAVIQKIALFLGALATSGAVSSDVITQVTKAINAANSIIQAALGLQPPKTPTATVDDLVVLIDAIEQTGVIPADEHLADISAMLKKSQVMLQNLDNGQAVPVFSFANPDNGKKVSTVLVQAGGPAASAIGL